MMIRELGKDKKLISLQIRHLIFNTFYFNIEALSIQWHHIDENQPIIHLDIININKYNVLLFTFILIIKIAIILSVAQLILIFFF